MARPAGWGSTERAQGDAFVSEKEARETAAIVADALEAHADLLEAFVRTNTRHPSYRGQLADLVPRVRVLRREAKRLRGQA